MELHVKTYFEKTITNKVNPMDYIAATILVILLKMDSNHRIFLPIWHWNLKDDLENNRASILCYVNFVRHFKAIGEFTLELQSGNVQF